VTGQVQGRPTGPASACTSPVPVPVHLSWVVRPAGAEEMLHEYHWNMPVFHGGAVAGMVSRAALITKAR
jgi:hypothetical protein